MLATVHLPDSQSGYVVAAYLVLFALVLIYGAIMAYKLARLERELVELNELADRELASGDPAAQEGPRTEAPEVTAP